MAGRIREEDVNIVRERAQIDEVVRETVTLKPAGGGSFKGLCPFHDERTASFHVTPSKGLYHCFSCGEGGDVITYVRKIDALSFTEAVERLADKYNIALRYEEGANQSATQHGQRIRLLEAHRIAMTYYQHQLLGADAAHAREFLTQRGFDQDSWATFAVGYSPAGWDGLTNLLRQKGFSQEEMVTAGLAVAGQRGAYDRFRDRLMWPIRDAGGDPIGFGARKLSESDQGPKYLNTPETPIYRKSQVLYGLDLARREMAKTHQAVVVEGYTDVMACHLAGITTAVATCGTAFGTDHVRILRRILLDDDVAQAQIVFTFDGDEAGRKAALKAFNEDQHFVASTYVAVEPHGLDPCDLRLKGGAVAVKELIAARVPLFEFVMRATINDYDLQGPEGRVLAMRAVAPILASIKDSAIRPEYIRMVAGWLSIDEATIRKEVGGGKSASSRQPVAAISASIASSPASANVGAIERAALKCVLQAPALVGEWFGSLEESVFTVPAAASVYSACVQAGNPLDFPDATKWVQAVLEVADDETANHVRSLAVEPMPVDQPDERYVQAILARVLEMDAGRRIDEIKGALQRNEMQDDTKEQERLLGDLLALEQYRRAMREFAVGDQ
ncbi:MAG: DNA primase [Actinobacteria bacterium]|nr:DNA primase [Actinomycetota bacterium]